MQPGLARGVSVGILGFLLGLLLVALIRALQSIDPVWDPQLALTMAAFTTSAAFVWGMGAANPAVNAHPHEPEEDEYGLLVVDEDAHDDHHAEDVEMEPRDTLGYTIWEISFWTILLMVGLFALATVSFGPALKVSTDPGAEPTQFTDNVSIYLPLLGDLEVTQFTLFVLFAGFTLLSLAVVGGGIGLAFVSLTKGVKEAQATEPQEPFALLTASASERKAVAEMQGIGTVSTWYLVGVAVLAALIMFILDGVVFKSMIEITPAWIRSLFSLVVGLGLTYAISYPVFSRAKALSSLVRLLAFIGIAVFLYWAFWYVLIYYALLGVDRIFGFSNATFFIGNIDVMGVFTIKLANVFDLLNTLLALGNAVGIGVTLLYPGLLFGAVGRGARGLARVLRGAPEFLGQK
ncbi:MAG: hypothetical protein RLP44_21980 [Aggregatilineales bacterium]